MLRKKLIYLLIYILPFIISHIYRWRSFQVFFYMYPLFSLINFPYERFTILLTSVLLDLLVDNIPRKIYRLKYIMSFSFTIIAIISKLGLKEDLNTILTGIQIAVGSFQAIRVFQKQLKKFRTDLGTVYYKLQIIILVNSIIKSEAYFTIIIEALLLMIIFFGVFLRPQFEQEKYLAQHGKLMRISYFILFLKYIFN